MALSPSTTRLLIVCFVALGSMTYGYCSSIIATTLGQPSFLSYFELDTSPNAAALEGTINSLFQVGGLTGALSCSYTADWLGRRRAMLVKAILTVLGGALQAGSVHIAMYIISRFITGIGVGALVTLVPLYQSEIAPPKIRGLLVGMHGVFIGTGYATAGWLGVAFYFVDAKNAQWRIPLAIQCIPPLLLAGGVLLVPESPRWLISRGRPDEAYQSFKSTRAESSDEMLTDEQAIRSEFGLLEANIRHEMDEELSFVKLFTNPSLRKRCLTGFLVMFGAQATATTTINNYGPTLYKSLGFGTVAQLVMAACWVTTAPFGNWVNALLVDRIGRIKMLAFGFSGCLLALIGECITVAMFDKTGHHGVAEAAVFFLFLHIGFFVLCVDGSTYIYASEIFPTPARAKGLAVSISGLFLATIVFLEAAPTAFANIGWKYYLVFASITFVNIFVIAFLFPETRLKSLEEIDDLFGGIGTKPMMTDGSTPPESVGEKDMDSATSPAGIKN